VRFLPAIHEELLCLLCWYSLSHPVCQKIIKAN
jgi:hypothetical protein